MKLITKENDSFILNQKIAENIVALENQKKKTKEVEDKLKKILLEEMEKQGILSLKDEKNGLTISYISAGDKETFDSKSFKKDNPDKYDEYVRITPVKSSIRIKVN